jgi:lysophospholipase L1-like esterase
MNTFLRLLLGVGLSIVCYNSYCMFKPPALNVSAFLATTAATSNEKPRVLLLGDSIFAGSIGHSWVPDLRAQHSGKDVINGGINAELAWNIRNRIDAVLAVKPDVVVLMVGTNDAMGSFRGGYLKGGDLYVAMGAPQKPTVAWHQENLKAVLQKLRDHGIQQRAVLTIPPLGEVRASKANKHVNAINANVKQVALETDTTVIDFNQAIWEEIDRLGGASSDTQEFTGIDVWAQTFGSVLHNVFGWNWNDVGQYNNRLRMLTDNCHLSERGADVLRSVVSQYLSLR